MLTRWFSVALVGGVLFGGCGQKESAEPESGQTTISLRLSGGHLETPLHFDGTIDSTPHLFSSSTKLLATGVNIRASNGDAELKQFTLSVETADSGHWDASDGDMDIVFAFEDIDKTYSLRPRAGTGGLEMTRFEEQDRAKFELHFDASPTQMNSKDIVFRLEGVIDGRN